MNLASNPLSCEPGPSALPRTASGPHSQHVEPPQTAGTTHTLSTCSGRGTVRAPKNAPDREESLLRGNRREFLKSATLAGAAAMAMDLPNAWSAEERARGLVDVNVNLGRWPLRRLPCDEPQRLADKLRSRGVVQAWAGSLDGLLHKDLAAVNARLAEACRKYGRGLLLPFGSINPKAPGWENDFRLCAEVHHMRGIRLHPNYHGYRLDDPDLYRLLKLASEDRLIVQIVLVMEDERMMHPRLRVEPAEAAPLAEIASQVPGLRLVLLNALRTLRGPALSKLVEVGSIFVEISMLEGVGGVTNLLSQVPAERILFGSHAPLFYLEAAEFKLKESSLTSDQLRAISTENAKRLLA